jgi:hypothetical protein
MSSYGGASVPPPEAGFQPPPGTPPPAPVPMPLAAPASPIGSQWGPASTAHAPGAIDYTQLDPNVPPAAGNMIPGGTGTAAPPPIAEPPTPPPGPGEAKPPVSLTPPVAGAGGATQMQGRDPTDAALSTILAPGAAAGVRPMGMSPADRALLEAKSKQAAAVQGQLGEVLQMAGDNQATFKDQADTLALDTQLAAHEAKKKSEEDARVFSGIRSDAKQAHTRIQGELADLQAQNVDPNRYFQSMSTPMKIGAALAIGLGEFGSHALGPHGVSGQNTALHIFESAMDREMEAQRTNMQKSVQLLRMRGDLDARGFDEQAAMAKAERESHQTTYSIGLADLDRRGAALDKTSAAYQSYLQLRAGIVQKMDEGTERHIQDEYQIRKRAETPVQVGGGANEHLRATIIEDAKKLEDTFREKGVNLPHEQAVRMAYERTMLRPVTPGGAYTQPPAIPIKGAGLGRAARTVAELDAQEEAAKGLLTIIDKGSALSPTDRATAATYAETLRRAGHETIPAQPMNMNLGGTRAAAVAALKHVQTHRNALVERAKGGGGGAETGDANNPDDLQE